MQCRWRQASLVLRPFVRRTHSGLAHHHSHGSGHTTNTLLTRTPAAVTVPAAAPEPVPAITLRPYQEACITACTDALAAGSTRIGVSLPTGAGKTTVFISLLSRIAPPAHSPRATQALIVVNTTELATQTAEQVRRMFPEWEVEVEQGTNHASGDADVTVATYQTLLRGNRLEKFDRRMLKAIIVDEAHHAASPSYRRLLAQFNSGISHKDAEKLQPPHDKVPIFGFSATFSRQDGLALGSVFEMIAYHRDFLDMIKEEWLCDVRFTSVKAEMDLGRAVANGATGDFVTASLARIVNTPEINTLVVRAWMDRAADRKSTLVFCVDIDHVTALTKAYRALGVDARYVYAETPAVERKELIRAFKNGEFPVLVNCAILTEGADIPNIDCVVLARPTRSRNLFAQMIGRGLRNSPATGKTDCRIIDFVGNNDRVSGAISVPTIFGLDPRLTDERDAKVLDIEDETPASLISRIAEIREAVSAGTSKKPARRPVSVIYEDFDNAAELEESRLASAGDAGAIESEFAWVNCGDNIYVLDCMWKGYVRIEPAGRSKTKDKNEMAFKAAYYALLPGLKTRFGTPLVLVRPEDNATLRDACRAADAYVKHVACRSPELQEKLKPFAQWRRAPATAAQKTLIRNRWLRNEYLSTKIDSIATMTRGTAFTEATRIKHGYIGRAKAKVKEVEKEIKMEAKYAAAEAQWKVEVGPLAS